MNIIIKKKNHIPLLECTFYLSNGEKQDFKKSFFFLFKQVAWLKDYYKMVEKLVIPELNARNDTSAIKWLTDRTNTFFFGLKLIPLFQIRICIMFIIFIVCFYSLFLHVTSTS